MIRRQGAANGITPGTMECSWTQEDRSLCREETNTCVHLVVLLQKLAGIKSKARRAQD
jgi:hypothetical protein